MKSISFIIPAYNCEKTLTEAVDSIVKTNLGQGDEIIIVNDASTDNTQVVVDSLKRKFSFIRSFQHKNNRGGGAARNTAVDNAQNELIFCLDSDNILSENSISLLKEKLINENADIACLGAIKYFDDPTGKNVNEIVFDDYSTTIASHLSESLNPGTSGNYLFTKSSWKKAGFYPEFAGALDTWGFCIRQLFTGSKFVVLENSHYLHRCSNDSYWMRFSKEKSPSLAATQLLVPYLHKLTSTDVNYILKNRESWFDKIATRPIHLYDPNKVSFYHKLEVQLLHKKTQLEALAKDKIVLPILWEIKKHTVFSSQLQRFRKYSTLDLYKSIMISSSSSSELVENKWQENCSEIVQAFHKFIPLNFLSSPVIRNTMFVDARGKWMQIQLDFLKEWYKNSLNKYLKEDAIGKPFIANLPLWTSHNSIHHLYHLAFFEKVTSAKIDSLRSIIEWGGGYGNLAKIVKRINPSITYTIIDLPIFCSLQYSYLASIFGEDCINLIGKDETSIVQGKFNIIPLHLLSKSLPKPDLFIATWSLSESTKETQEIVYKSKFFNSKHLLIAYQDSTNDFTHASYISVLAKKLGATVSETPYAPNNYYAFI
jgi:glycosyltransferase involved in cell wall biosynthesis